MDKVPWQTVVIIGIVVTATVALAAMHVDPAVIWAPLAVFGIGSGMHQLGSIKTNVNGNLGKLVELLTGALDKLAQQPPPSGDSYTEKGS